MNTPHTYAQKLAFIAFLGLLFFLAIIPQSEPFSAPQIAHLILATGAFPLIIGAMIYFTPTLTRSGAPTGWVGYLPFLAFFAGATAFYAVSHNLQLIALAAPLAICICAALLYWIDKRVKNSLGDPHPGLAWYQAALIFLIIGLLSISATLLWPDMWLELRNIHLQLNLMGFLGLTAIGTLQVFLPTVGRYQATDTGLRLKKHLKFALVGTIFLAAGALEIPYCNIIGRLLWLIPLLALINSGWQNRSTIINTTGTALSMFGALWGFTALTVTGKMTELPMLFYFFLFPLVTGALSHLLPLWWWPGFPAPKREQSQLFLGKFATLRLLAFWLAGVVLLTWNPLWAQWLAMVTLLIFMGQLLFCRYNPRFGS